jgi:hypothetical protein
VCEAGSVRVDALARVESHPARTIWFRRWTLRDGVDTGALLGHVSRRVDHRRAKVRAMEIIAELEASRGVTRRADLIAARTTPLSARPSARPSSRPPFAGTRRRHRLTRTRSAAEAWLKTAALRWPGRAPGAELDRCSSGRTGRCLTPGRQGVKFSTAAFSTATGSTTRGAVRRGAARRRGAMPPWRPPPASPPATPDPPGVTPARAARGAQRLGRAGPLHDHGGRRATLVPDWAPPRSSSRCAACLGPAERRRGARSRVPPSA